MGDIRLDDHISTHTEYKSDEGSLVIKSTTCVDISAVTEAIIKLYNNAALKYMLRELADQCGFILVPKSNVTPEPQKRESAKQTGYKINFSAFKPSGKWYADFTETLEFPFNPEDDSYKARCALVSYFTNKYNEFIVIMDSDDKDNERVITYPFCHVPNGRQTV